MRGAGCRFRGERYVALGRRRRRAPFLFYGQCVGSIGDSQRLFPFFYLIGQSLETCGHPEQSRAHFRIPGVTRKLPQSRSLVQIFSSSRLFLSHRWRTLDPPGRKGAGRRCYEVWVFLWISLWVVKRKRLTGASQARCGGPDGPAMAAAAALIRYWHRSRPVSRIGRNLSFFLANPVL